MSYSIVGNDRNNKNQHAEKHIKKRLKNLPFIKKNNFPAGNKAQKIKIKGI